MKSQKSQLLGVSYFFMFFLILLVANSYTQTQESLLDTLNRYYKYSQNKDIDNFIAIQDEIYLNIIFENNQENMRNYYLSGLELIDINNFEISNLDFETKEDYALVFYNLKSEITYKETNQKEILDNDMVAFLWKYENEYKIRWIITQTLYQLKIESEIINNAASELTLATIDEENTIKNTLIKQELITIEEIEKTLTKTASQQTSNEDKTENNSQTYQNTQTSFKKPFFLFHLIKQHLILTFLIMILGVFLYFYFKNDTFKQKTHYYKDKTIKKSKELYSKSKPHIKKAYKKTKEYIIYITPIILVFIKKVIKATIKIIKTLIDKVKKQINKSSKPNKNISKKTDKKNSETHNKIENIAEEKDKKKVVVIKK